MNPGFTDENASAIVVSDEIILMLLSPGFAEQSGLAVTEPDRHHLDFV